MEDAEFCEQLRYIITNTVVMPDEEVENLISEILRLRDETKNFTESLILIGD